MAFINNHTDNFLPSKNPWGDDNVQVYNFPNQTSLDLSSMDFQQLDERFNDMKINYQSLPPCKAKHQLKQKMMSISNEMRKRDSLEDITRIDRDDNFETPTRIIKEDVITPTPPLDMVFDNIDPVIPIERPIIQQQVSPESVSIDDGNEILEDILEEVEEMELESTPSVNRQASIGGKNKDVDNFLIAALVVITIIAVTK